MALGPSVYKLIFDTQGLNTLVASRRELALQKKILEETVTSEDKLAQSEANLDRMVQKSLITVEQKSKVMEQLSSEMKDAESSNNSQLESIKRLSMAQASGIPIVGKLVAAFEAGGPIGLAFAVAMMEIKLAADAVSFAINTVTTNVTKQIGKIDDLIASAATINVPVEQFQRLAHAARLADIEQSAFAAGTEKMLVGISKAAGGGTNNKLKAAFDIAKLDAKELRELQPEEAFRRITAALDEVPNAADRARAASAIFGSADFLRIDTSHIDRAASLMDRLRQGVDNIDPRVFGEFDDNVQDMNAAFDVTWQKLAMEVVPALGDAAAAVTDMLVAFNQNDAAMGALDEISVKLRTIVAIAKQVPEVLMTWSPAAEFALGVVKQANPKTGMAIEGAERIGGGLVADVSDSIRRGEELDKKMAAINAKREEAATGVGIKPESDLDAESDSIDKLLEKLKEEIATRGMSAAMAKVWKLEQLGAAEDVIEENRALAEEYDRLQKADKATKAIQTFTESLLHQGETAAESARRLADLKLANDGVDEATRKSLMAQFDLSEAQKKADAETKKNTDSLKKQTDALAEQEAKLRAYSDAVGTHEEKLIAAQRAELAHNLAAAEAGPIQTAAALATFDRIKALEKERDANKVATDKLVELEKRRRQIGMTSEQKKIDDTEAELRKAGVSEEQIKLIAGLEKELSLREKILQQALSTSGVVKAGTREAADAIAHAAQIATREQTIKDRGAIPPIETTVRVAPAMDRHSSSLDRFSVAVDKWIASDKTIPPGGYPATVTATPVPPEPTVSGTIPYTIPIGGTASIPQPPAVATEPLSPTIPYTVDASPTTTFTQETLPRPSALVATPPKPPVVSQASANQQNTKLQADANGILSQIRDKIKPPEIQEVTL